VNAFENPVRSSQGYTAQSIDQLNAEYAKLKETWGVKAAYEKAIPDVTLNEFLDGMVSYVN
jgi:CRISPR system Cascade subunit CasC